MFEWVEKVGMDIGKHKQRRKSQWTWKDSMTMMMFLNQM
jgi:hypothetical protein